jgi:hypothetical protein
MEMKFEQVNASPVKVWHKTNKATHLLRKNRHLQTIPQVRR